MPGIRVEGEGHKKCLLALVGEAPGAEEEIQGRPFVGTSGNILNTKLHLVGISRQECYITNLVKYRPPGNNFSIYWNGKSPTVQLLDARDELLKELDQLETNLIVALGANALWALTGKHQIGKWRGSTLSLVLPSGKSVKVIGTYHPAALAREWVLGATMQYDLKKALREAGSTDFTKIDRNLLIAPTFNDILTYLSERRARAFDIETTYTNIVCCSVAYSPKLSMSIPTTKEYWGSFSRLREVLLAIHHNLTMPGYTNIGQNMTFDIQYLVKGFGILPEKPWFDTMIAQHSCYLELPKSLNYLASIYTNEVYYKDDLKTWQAGMADNELLWRYNAMDSAVTFECRNELELEMEDLCVKHTFDYMMELLEPLLYMMLRGVKLDFNIIENYKAVYSKSLKEKETRFTSSFGGINPRSSKQVAKLAYEQLGLTPVMKKGKITTDKKAIEKLAIKSPEIAEIVGIRADGKMISTYIDVKVDPIDKRLRCSYNSAVANTGRLSSSESVFGYGNNLQNWPKKIRNMVVPEEGMMFTEADLKGAEAMIVAYLSEDPFLIRLFEKGEIEPKEGMRFTNVHTFTGYLIWGYDEQFIKDNKKKCDEERKDTESYYFKAKKTRHSANYRGSWVTVSEELRVPAAEAKNILFRFNNASPNLIRWHREIEDEVRRTRTLITPLGRKRIFFERWGPGLLRQATAFKPQETVAQILNLGLINIYEFLCSRYKDINIALQVHDSVLLEHPTEMKDFVHEKLKELMRVNLTIKGRTFYIPIDIKSGFNWRDLE